ncbi:hypothetical protein CLF_104417 [Clonorchis sinensis]|uniref:PDZ domain-containing protein n=1 Tax=Clonorchis sinensis TaxID=79923 RepID=G7YBM3_CLOSI|nr:hypothetical protein CLF_104417 [Clonorchis sinensis]
MPTGFFIHVGLNDYSPVVRHRGVVRYWIKQLVKITGTDYNLDHWSSKTDRNRNSEVSLWVFSNSQEKNIVWQIRLVEFSPQSFTSELLEMPTTSAVARFPVAGCNSLVFTCNTFPRSSAVITRPLPRVQQTIRRFSSARASPSGFRSNYVSPRTPLPKTNGLVNESCKHFFPTSSSSKNVIPYVREPRDSADQYDDEISESDQSSVEFHQSSVAIKRLRFETSPEVLPSKSKKPLLEKNACPVEFSQLPDPNISGSIPDERQPQDHKYLVTLLTKRIQVNKKCKEQRSESCHSSDHEFWGDARTVVLKKSQMTKDIQLELSDDEPLDNSRNQRTKIRREKFGTRRTIRLLLNAQSRCRPLRKNLSANLFAISMNTQSVDGFDDVFIDITLPISETDKLTIQVSNKPRSNLPSADADFGWFFQEKTTLQGSMHLIGRDGPSGWSAHLLTDGCDAAMGEMRNKVFVKSFEGDPYKGPGALRTGDQIISINGIDVRSLKFDDALQEIRQSEDTVILAVKSPRKLTDATEFAAPGRLMFQLLRYSRYRDTCVDRGHPGHHVCFYKHTRKNVILHVRTVERLMKLSERYAGEAGDDDCLDLSTDFETDDESEACEHIIAEAKSRNSLVASKNLLPCPLKEARAHFQVADAVKMSEFRSSQTPSGQYVSAKQSQAMVPQVMKLRIFIVDGWLIRYSKPEMGTMFLCKGLVPESRQVILSFIMEFLFITVNRGLFPKWGTQNFHQSFLQFMNSKAPAENPGTTRQRVSITARMKPALTVLCRWMLSSRLSQEVYAPGRRKSSLNPEILEEMTKPPTGLDDMEVEQDRCERKQSQSGSEDGSELSGDDDLESENNKEAEEAWRAGRVPSERSVEL